MSADETTATPLDLDGIEARAEDFPRYGLTGSDRRLIDEDVPALVAEVRHLRARVAALTTELDDTAAELLDVDDVQPAPATVCPECAAGKHGNCDGIALDVTTDRLVTCHCHIYDHR